MALSRKGKIWLIVLGIPVVLLIAAGIVLKMMFTSEKLKEMAIPRIEAATHRDVAINEMNLALFPTLAVEMEGFSMSNAKGPGFSEAPFLTLDKLVVDVRLMPLLKGNVEISTMRLERPHVLIEVTEKGVSNYADLKTPPDTGAAQPGTREQPRGRSGVILLPEFRIVDGSIDYIDRKGNSAMKIEGLNQTLSLDYQQAENHAVLDGETSIAGFTYGTVTAPLVSNLRMTYKERMVYKGKVDSLLIENGAFTLEDMKMTAGGTAAGLTTTPRLDLTVQSDNINIADVFSLIPKEYMKKAQGLKGNGTARAQLRIVGAVSDSANPDISGQINASNASIQYEKLPRPISNITIAATFFRSKTRQEFHVARFTANLGDNPISATMDMVNFDNPSIAMTLNGAMNLAEVGQFYPLEQGTEVSGRVTANVNIAGKVSTPATMKATGSMQFQNVMAKTAASKTPVQNLQGSITFNNQVIEAKNVSLTMGKSDLALGFMMKNYLSMMSKEKGLPRPTANLTLRSNHLYTADVMTETPKNAPPANAPAPSAPPQKQEQKPAAAKEKTAAGMGLPDVDMDIAATIGTLTMEKFEFTNVRATMKIASGIITMQNFSLNAFGGSVVTKGTLDMRAPARPGFDLALDMNGLDAHNMLSQFSSFGQRLNGKMTMNTTMKGTLDDTLGLIPNTLNGAGRVQMADGKLTGVKANKAVAGLLNLPDLENITFKDWTNSFTVANGRIIVKDLKISALDADYLVNGSQGLDGSLDYTMSLLLPEKTSSRVTIPGLGGQAASLFKDESGRVKLDFSVGGTTDDPKVALDTKAAQRKGEEMAKQKVNEQVKKVEEQAKKKAGDVLKDIFKKKK